MRQLHPNIFKKKKEEIEQESITPIIEEFLTTHNIHLSFFTDGSKVSAGVDYAVTSEEFIFEAKKVHPFNSIFLTEAYAVFRAVKLILFFFPDNNLNFVIFTDSRSTIEALGSNSQKKNEIINKNKNVIPSNIRIVWVPSHTNVKGNDLADEAAKKHNCFWFEYFELFIYIGCCYNNKKRTQDNFTERLGASRRQ